MSCLGGGCFPCRKSGSEYPFLSEYGLKFFLWSIFFSPMTISTQLLTVQYGVNGLGLSWRFLSDLLQSLFYIYASTYVGYFSDRLRTPYGSRKPVMVLGLVLIAVSLVGLVIGLSLPYNSQAAFFLLFTIISSVGQAFFIGGYQPWIVSISPHLEAHSYHHIE